MTQIVNTAGAIGDPSIGTPTAGPATPAPAPIEVAQPAVPDPADLRLVIEDDQAAGCFVYKTIDWRTGEVVQQLPREQLLKLREADAYLAGDVIKTQA
jgi:flagellar protein FlaG